MTFDEILAQVLDLLQRQGRVSYRALKRRFDLDDAYLEDLKAEIIKAQRLAIDEAGEVLVWSGAAPPQTQEPQPPDTPAAQDLPISPPTIEREAPEAERRQLTVLFCDLVDSTAFAARLDPEELREVVRAYQAAGAEMIGHFEGHIAQYLGDGLLVYFGYPLAHEDDAQRAVRAGLGILEALEQLNTRLTRERGIRLAVRLGIHTGLVVVGEMGAGARYEQLALGETPNLAARLQGLAAPDTVVISATTYRLVQGFFACHDLGSQTLKGSPTPVLVYRVLGESGAQSRLETAGPSGLTPLVGREPEVTLLQERWAQSTDGLGQVVLLSGEAGIGKSRLVQVLKAHVEGEPHTRLECRCSPYYQNSALYPVIDLFQRILQLHRDDTPPQKLSKLEGALEQYGFSLSDMVPLFTSLLSLPSPDRYPALALTPQRQRQKTLEAVLAVLLALAARQPLLFIVEDLHWVDPSTLELLSLLLDQGLTAPMMALLTCRPEFRPPWGFRAHLTPITLNRLPCTQVAVMVERVMGGKALPAEVHQQVVARTDGVPLFVEELTSTLLLHGEVVPARAHLEQSLALYNPQEHRALAFRAGIDLAAWCLSYVAQALWKLGYPDQALRRSHEALLLAQEVSHSPSLAAVLFYVAFIHCYRRDAPATQEQAEAAMALASAQGLPQWLTVGRLLRGWALAMQGQAEEGIAQMRPALAAWRLMGSGLAVSHYLVLLAEAYGRAGQAKEGLCLLAEALVHIDTTGEVYWAAEVYWLKGELLLCQAIPDETQAETCLHQALDIARRQQTRAWELRAAVSLARLWQRQGKRAAAQRMLVEIYGWFTEGFDTVDLQDAKALLEGLS